MNHQISSGFTAQVRELGPWFHNLHLPDGTQTASDHFLGDFPSNKWELIRQAIPDDLHGWTALDIGCNAGFYSFELARRGAQVTAIDMDEHYLRQARWAAEVLSMEQQIRFEQKQIYHLAQEPEVYDLCWFMGVLYHLRYPLLGLDIVARKTRHLLVLQTMTFPGDEAIEPPEDMLLSQRDMMQHPGWPKMAFIERQLERDPTNWWAANHACVEAMLRSTGMEVIARPAHEVYICRPSPHGRPLDHFATTEYVAATQHKTC